MDTETKQLLLQVQADIHSIQKQVNILAKHMQALTEAIRNLADLIAVQKEEQYGN